MSGYHKIALPRNQPVEFPDRCVDCLQPRPEHTLRIREHELSLLLWLLPLPSRSAIIVVPFCVYCRSTFLWRRRITNLVFYVIGLIVLSPMVPTINQVFPVGVNRIGLTDALFFALGTPAVFFTYYCPRSFDVTVFGKSIDYEFREPVYAAIFARLNGTAVPPQVLAGALHDCSARMDGEELKNEFLEI